MTELKEIDSVAGDYTGLSRTVLEYCRITKTLVQDAKKPDFSREGLAPLAELIAVDEFERVGNFKEVMDWSAYADFLMNWATASEWECSFKRVTETPNTVFLELEERSRIGDFANVVNSFSVFEFNEAGKIRHIDMYLQMEPFEPEMLKSFEGVGDS